VWRRDGAGFSRISQLSLPMIYEMVVSSNGALAVHAATGAHVKRMGRLAPPRRTDPRLGSRVICRPPSKCPQHQQEHALHRGPAGRNRVVR
jgi:hypothetical protein